MMDRIEAPFTPEQVASLNAFQLAGVMHPFTCGAEDCHGIRLIAARDGWHCASQICDYRQGWAHAFMADWSWLRLAAGFTTKPEWLAAEFEAHAAELLAIANERSDA